MHPRHVVLLTVVSVAASACGNNSGRAIINAEVLASRLAITPAASDISVGDVVTLTCHQFRPDGSELQTPLATSMTSTPAGVAPEANRDKTEVLPVRSYIGAADGMATVECKVQQGTSVLTATATITVHEYKIFIDPNTKSATAGGPSVTFSADVRRFDGGLPSETIDEAKITWSVAPTTVATVGGGGVGKTVPVQPVSTGTATLTARYAGRYTGIGTATLVVAAGLTVTNGTTNFNVNTNSSTVIPYAVADAAGSPVTDAVITATATGPCTVTVTNGVVSVRGTAQGACTVTITATKGASTGSKTYNVTVTNAPPTTAVLVAAGTGGAVGSTRQLFGIMPTGDVMQFAAAASLTEPANWANQLATGFASSNTAVATVSPSGIVTGVAPGTAGITGQWSSGGVDYTASFSALVGTLDSTTPSSISMSTLSGLSNTVRVGKVTAYLCTATNAGAAVIANQAWTTSNPAVATVNSAGIVTGVSAGSATITCNINGRSTTMPTTVTP